MIEPFEFDGGTGHHYKCRRMAAYPTQALVVKRLGVVLEGIYEYAAGGMNGSGALMIARALQEMKDEDLTFVLHHCLELVERRTPDGKWEAVWNRQARIPQFADMGLDEILDVAIRVIMETFGPFLARLLTPPPDGQAEPPRPPPPS